MILAPFTREDFVRHLRNVAGLGLALYILGILTGYVTNWVSVMIGIGVFTLFFADHFLGHTRGTAYFWLYLFIQGLSNFRPYRFPLDQEAWKIQTNDTIAWMGGGHGTPLFPGPI